MVYRISNKAMLTGEKLGQAIAQAIAMKGVTKAAVARHFGVKPPSVQEWIKYGRIGKERLGALFSYFSDVCEPGHWGLSDPERLLLSDPMTIAGDVIVRSVTPASGAVSSHELLPRQSNEPTNELRRFPVFDWTDSPRYASATPASYETLPDDPAFSHKCFAVVMQDSSMQMSIPRGNTLLIDPARQLEDGGAYLFDGPSGPIVRRVRRGVSGWVLLEEDGRNSPAEAMPDRLKVVGRVVMSSRKEP